jgi:flavodoxin
MMSENKSLVAYYSRPGNNYMGGSIVDLPVGNTEVAAKFVQELTGSEIFRIDTVTAYPPDYHETVDAAKAELRQNARPELSGHVDEMGEFGTIYLGFPNWCGTMPMAVWTFLEEYDFTGKTIAPFCTHEGSRMGRSENDIRKLCPGARVLKGLPIVGGSVQGAENDIADWLRDLGPTS